MGCSCKKFMSCRPPLFEGSSDAKMILRWLREMEQTFDCCDCDEEHKVRYATGMLRGSALLRWNMVSKPLGEATGDQMNWEAFKAKFTIVYCIKRDIFNLEDDFLKLEKGNMTIGQYANLFVEKLRFAGRMAPNEESKVNRFVSGLPSYYWPFIEKMTTLNAAIQEAKMIEDDLVNEEEEKKSMGSFKKFNLVKDDSCKKQDTYIMEEEFLNLKKGNMSIEQYAELFMEKLRFAGRLAPDEESKVNRFVRGLPSSYRPHVRNMATLNAAIKVAKMVENGFVEQEHGREGYE